MMTRPGFPHSVFRRILDLLCKLLTLTAVVGVPFWWFMVQLSEHGWK